jgi:hypothetical protein
MNRINYAKIWQPSSNMYLTKKQGTEMDPPNNTNLAQALLTSQN